MPFVYDFSKALTKVSEVPVFPAGWHVPLFVEYCEAQVNQHDPQLSICWRVKGTTHTFTIYEKKLNELSNGNYKEHFETVLSAFRKDYLSWFEGEYKGKDIPWRDEYERQFGPFIVK